MIADVDDDDDSLLFFIALSRESILRSIVMYNYSSRSLLGDAECRQRVALMVLVYNAEERSLVCLLACSVSSANLCNLSFEL